MILSGEYELALDSKNRLFIPAKLRELMAPAAADGRFYLVLGAHKILCLYPADYYERIALAVAPRRVAPADTLAFARVNFGLAGKVELDRQGRILLSEKMIRRAKLQGQITLVGIVDHLEIWNRQQWELYLEDHLEQHENLLIQAQADFLQHAQERAIRQLDQAEEELPLLNPLEDQG